MYPSHISDGLSSFDEIIAEQSISNQSSRLLGSHVCSIQSSMCFAMEGLMTTLFTPPGCDWASEDNNSVVDLTDNPSAALAAPPIHMESRPMPMPHRTHIMSPRKVCSLWKKKRKAEKKRIVALRQQQEDLALHSEVKLSALRVQRSFERKVTGDDSDEELQRASYEKYGRRAEFIRDLRQ